jgi:hypothetical protein
MAILSLRMRRFLPLLVVLACALPAAAWATRSLPGDGTLVVDNASGTVVVKGRGGIIGRFDSGRIVIEDPIAGDGSGPKVYGDITVRDLGNRRTMYIGDQVRFRLIGGTYRVRIQAIGIDVSAVGHGIVTLDASGFSDVPGRFSINGGPFQPVPTHPTNYTLGQAPAQSGK